MLNVSRYWTANLLFKTVIICTFLWWLGDKEWAWQCRSCEFNPWVGKIPWRRKWQPTPVFLPAEFHWKRSLVSCSSWGLKESDTTKRLNNNKTSKQSYHKSNHNVSDLIDKWLSKVIGYLRKNINTLSCWYLLFSPLVMSNSWQPHGLQHTRLSCPSPSPRACCN